MSLNPRTVEAAANPALERKSQGVALPSQRVCGNLHRDRCLLGTMRIATFILASGLIWPAWADNVLWQRLRTEKNLVVFIRHTQPGGGDPLIWDESGNCKGESMLTLAGKAHAKRIGEAFAAHGINPTVISSPMCRCLDTARIAFGDSVVTDKNLREVASADSDRIKTFEARLYR